MERSSVITVDHMTQQMSDMQDRGHNIIFRGIPECDSEDGVTRRDHDIRGVMRVMDLSSSFARKKFCEQVRFSRRLGSYEKIKQKLDKDEVPHRPLLVKLETNEQRDLCFRSWFRQKLKERNELNGTRYRVDPDLTKEQRDKLEAMWKEAHQKTMPEVRFYVVGQENPVLRSR